MVRSKAIEGVRSSFDVLLRPQWMIIAHRLAPVGKRECRVDTLRLLEREAGLVELETVQRLDARQERALRLLGPGIRE